MAAQPHPSDSAIPDLGLRDLLRQRVDQIFKALREGARRERILSPQLEDVIRAREQELGFRWFDRVGIASDYERRKVLGQVIRSTAELAPPAPGEPDRRRSVYELTIVPPSGARRADLRQATRAAMAVLERLSGPLPLPPWLAVERQVPRPHVQLVMSIRREVGRGEFQAVPIGAREIATMREAVNGDLARQLDNFHLRSAALSVYRSNRPLLLTEEGREVEAGPTRSSDGRWQSADRVAPRPNVRDRSDREQGLER